MPAPIISVRNLGKRYRLGEALAHDTLRDHITHAMGSLKRMFSGNEASKNESEVLWALKDVSFDVAQGEIIGIVGRNGAGKSTLLKLLSRISEPTTGEIRLRGRMASLLEVGTGFHPELTGRENIFLNGAILGMRQTEIKKKFDEIVEFSEVQRFLDTPVKHYSSGMYVKLAFAVAAHLDPEILVVDEVLAVGDIQFQKKCLGKMAHVSQSGRTVLFVSHNLAAVRKLCTRGILLEQGTLRYDGGTEDCITRYLQGAKDDFGDVTGYAISHETLESQAADAGIFVTRLEIFDVKGGQLESLNSNEGFKLRIHYKTNADFARGAVSFMVNIKSHLGQELCRLSTMPISGYNIEELARVGYLDLTIKSLPLVGGRYLLDVSAYRPQVETMLRLREVAAIEIAPTDVYRSGIAMDQNRGLLVVDHQWHHEIIQAKNHPESVQAKSAEV